MHGQRPRVFISYSHDSPEHRKRVLSLAERFRADGVDAQIDQYVQGTPLEGWARWIRNQLASANFILLVCTETYYRRFCGCLKLISFSSPCLHSASARSATPLERCYWKMRASTYSRMHGC
jgi:hypothetical protein